MLIKINVTKKYRAKNPSGQYIEKIQGYCKEDELIRNLNTFLPSALNFLEVEKKLKIEEKDLPELNRILHFKADASVNILNQFEKNWHVKPKIYIEYYNIQIEKKGE